MFGTELNCPIISDYRIERTSISFHSKHFHSNSGNHFVFVSEIQHNFVRRMNLLSLLKIINQIKRSSGFALAGKEFILLTKLLDCLVMALD
jgi:hypothetical protein